MAQDDPRDKLAQFVKQLRAIGSREAKFQEHQRSIDADLIAFVAGAIEGFLDGSLKSLDAAFGVHRWLGYVLDSSIRGKFARLRKLHGVPPDLDDFLAYTWLGTVLVKNAPDRRGPKRGGGFVALDDKRRLQVILKVAAKRGLKPEKVIREVVKVFMKIGEIRSNDNPDTHRKRLYERLRDWRQANQRQREILADVLLSDNSGRK